MLMATHMSAKSSYYPDTDFSPIGMTAQGTLLLVAHPKTGVNSASDVRQKDFKNSLSRTGAT